jgi:hypothetical protein
MEPEPRAKESQIEVASARGSRLIRRRWPDWTLTIGENRTGVPSGSEAASSPGNSN